MTLAPPNSEASGDTASILSLYWRSPLTVLWERRWLVSGAILLAVVIAVAYLAVATPMYGGTAQVVVEQNAPRLIPNDPTGMTVATTQNFLWQQCSLIQSGEILRRVADDPAIRSLPSFSDSASVVDSLRGMVNASVGRRDDIIAISVISPYPEDAARIANSVVLAFVKYHEADKRTKSRELQDILQNEKQKLDQDLAAKQQEKLDFRLRNAAFSLGTGYADPAMERLNRLSTALTEAQLNTLTAQAQYQTAKATIDDPERSRQLLELRQFKSEAAQLRAELRELQQRLASLSKSYLPGFPELTAIQTSIRQLQDEMAAEDRRIMEAYVGELLAQVESSKARQTQIQTLLNEQRAEVLARNRIVASYEAIEEELKRLKERSDLIYARIKDVTLTEEVNPLKIRPVEIARASANAVFPRKSIVLGSALLIGAVVGAGLSLLREWTDQRLRSAEEVTQVLGLQVLGIVPHIINGDSPAARGTLLHSEPMSEAAEAYRTVRTAVYFGQPGAIAKTLLITSPSPGDGKTTLASNLAIAMAQAGNRILLLDADFRKPAQHKIFGLDKSRGLSTVLAGEAPLATAVQHTSIPGLDVLPCGPIPANPSEILNSQTFADVLAELAGQYDHVLLDSPPVLAVTDARILAASCDATVLALRAERSTRRTARHSRDLLASVGSAIIGVVVNDVPRRKGLYGYYYSYGDGYEYQYGYGSRRTVRSKQLPAGGNGAHAPAAAELEQPKDQRAG